MPIVLEIPGNGFWTAPGDVRRLGRSFWRGHRTFVIEGSRGAGGGWENFSESFRVDDLESARYLSWYYTMLAQFYALGGGVGDLQKLLAADPAQHLVDSFDVATGHPRRPALVIVSRGLRAALGAHLKPSETGRVEWQLDPRYAPLFSRIAALAVTLVSLWDFPPGSSYLVGWSWCGHPLSRRHLWFIDSYDPAAGTARGVKFGLPDADDIHLYCAQLYDTNIFIPLGSQRPRHSFDAPVRKRRRAKWKPASRNGSTDDAPEPDGRRVLLRGDS